MNRKNWTREELILAINLYCKTPFGRLHNRNPDIIKLSKLIGRTPSALSWKLVNFASLDPSLKKRGIKGAINVSHLDREIWEEFYSDWDRLAYESEILRANRLGEPIEPDVEAGSTELSRSGLDRKTLAKVRVNQNFFRATVLAAYESRCCITGLAIPDLLNASHIIPWSKDEKNRVNPQNGLCLNAIHDRAFDRGLLTVTPEYKVMLSASIRKSAGRSEAVQHLLTRYDGEKIRLPRKFLPDRSFLEYHNRNVFKQ
jgi:putative restriction endonuclease